jgi:O-antigen ligase
VIDAVSRREARPAGLPIAVALVPAGVVFVLIAVMRYDTRDTWLSTLHGLIGGSLLLAFSSPVFAVIAPVLTEYSSSHYSLPEGVSLRLLATALGFLFGLGAVLRLVGRFDRRLLWVLGPALALVLLATVLNAMYTSPDYTIKYLRYQLLQIMILLLVAGAIQTRLDLKRVALVVLAIGVVSAFMALWQHYERPSAPFVAVGSRQIASGPDRAVGLNMNYIHLANTLLWIGTGLLGFLLANRWRSDRRHFALMACALMAIAAVYFTYTRSAMLALGPALIAMSIFLSPRRRVLVYGLLVGAAVSYFVLQGTGVIGGRYYKDASKDKSAADHLALFEVGLRVALDNPVLGIGHEAFEFLAADYGDEIQPSQSGTGPSGLGALGSARPHNDFLLVWMSWGIFALLAYCGIFVGALLNFAKAARSGDPLIRGLAVGGVGGLGAYAANCFFHNYLDSSTLLWAFAGLSVALVHLPDQLVVGSRGERVERTRRRARLARRSMAAA